MNFFNFKRKHWIIVGIFLGFNILFVIAFAVFIHRLHANVIKAHRESLIPSNPHAVSPEKEAVGDVRVPEGTLTVGVGTCTSCAANQKEAEKITNIINNAEVAK